MNMSQVLQKIMEERALRGPDGRPLYAYRLSPGEQRALEQAWSPDLAQQTSHAAAFCLLAARHFCATYQQGPWSWKGTLRQLGWDQGLPSLYSAVTRGLSYWRRPLLVTPSAREYLLTLACEGGLPLGVLADEDRQVHLSRYLRLLLEANETHGAFGAEALALRYQEVLPRSLQQDLVRKLCVQLVQEVGVLRATVPRETEPVKWLDLHRAGWRESLSVEVSSQVAERLVEGLVRHVVREQTSTLLVEVVSQLKRGSESASVRRSLRWTSEVSREELADFFGINAGDISGRVYLSALTQGRKLRVATIVPRGQRYRVQVDSEATLEGVEAVHLVASTGGRELATITPPGGEALEELPWIFRNGQSMQHELLGVGSTQTRETVVYVALPPDWTITEGEAEPVDVALVVREKPWTVVRLSSDASLVGADSQSVSVRLGVEVEPTRYVVRGRFLGGEADSGVMVGRPSVVKLVGNRAVQVVPDANLWWKPLVGGWGCVLHSPPLGEGWIAVREQGHEVFRARVRLLPSDFELRAKPELNRAEGRLEARGHQVQSLGLLGPSSVQGSAEGRCQLALHAPQEVPTHVLLEVLLGPSGRVRFQAPFPESSARFVRFAGGTHPADIPVSIQRLGQVAARATGELASSNLVVVAQTPHGRYELGRLREVRAGLAQLALDELRGELSLLLASSNDLDEGIRLKLERLRGDPTPLATLTVKRYEGALTPVRVGMLGQPVEKGSDSGRATLLDRPSGEIPAERTSGPTSEVPSSVPSGRPSGAAGEVVTIELGKPVRAALGRDASQLVVELHRMDNPDMEAVTLASGAEGQWVVPEGLEPGPWMVLARQGGLVRLRPLCLNVRLSEVAPPSSPLRAATLLTRRSERQQALKQSVAELASSYAQADWSVMQALLGTMKQVPAASYEAILALSENPQAAAMALLVASEEMLPVLFRGLEELPLAWFLVSQHTWAAAVEKLVEWCQHVAPEAQAEWRRALVSARMGAFLKQIGRLSLPIGVLAEKIALVMNLLKPEDAVWVSPTRVETRVMELQEALEDVVRGHDGERWPEMDLEEEELRSPEWRAAVMQQLPRIDRVPGHCRPVLLAPFAAASLVLSGAAISTVLTRKLRWLRGFDEEWFDRAMATYLAIHQL